MMHLIFHELFAFTEKMTERPGSAFSVSHPVLSTVHFSPESFPQQAAPGVRPAVG